MFCLYIQLAFLQPGARVEPNNANTFGRFSGRGGKASRLLPKGRRRGRELLQFPHFLLIVPVCPRTLTTIPPLGVALVPV